MSLRVGFASAVRHAADYLQILAGDDRVDLVVVGEEPDAASWMRQASRAAAEGAGVRYTEDLGELLDPARVDLVVVCSEPIRHHRLAAMAIEAGIDVLVDKPVATTLVDADRLAEAARAHGRVCAVVNRTHAPALRRTRAWVDAGHIGLPRHIDVEFFASGTHFETSVERPELVVDPALSGGGEVLNFLGYCSDAVGYLTGLPVREVHALTGSLFAGPHGEYGVEDSAVVSLLLERGVTATITLGRVPYAPGNTPTTSSLRVLGSHGHAVADDDKPAVDVFGPDGGTAVVPDAGRVALTGYLRHVVDALAAGETPDYTVIEAREAMAVIDAAYRAADTGDVITLQ